MSPKKTYSILSELSNFDNSQIARRRVFRLNSDAPVSSMFGTGIDSWDEAGKQFGGLGSDAAQGVEQTDSSDREQQICYTPCCTKYITLFNINSINSII